MDYLIFHAVLYSQTSGCHSSIFRCACKMSNNEVFPLFHSLHTGNNETGGLLQRQQQSGGGSNSSNSSNGNGRGHSKRSTTGELGSGGVGGGGVECECGRAVACGDGYNLEVSHFITNTKPLSFSRLWPRL